MDIEEAYQVMQEASGIKVGDRVRVLRPHRTHEMGYRGGNYYPENVGFEAEVLDMCGTDGVHLARSAPSGNRFFPFFVLEVIEPAHTIRAETKWYDENGKDVTDTISEETKRNHRKES